MRPSVLQYESNIMIGDSGILKGDNIIVGIFSQDRNKSTHELESFMYWCSDQGYNPQHIKITTANYHIDNPQFEDIQAEMLPHCTRLGLMSVGDLMCSKQSELYEAISITTPITPAISDETLTSTPLASILSNTEVYIFSKNSTQILGEFYKDKYDVAKLCPHSQISQTIRLNSLVKKHNMEAIESHCPFFNKIKTSMDLDFIIDEIYSIQMHTELKNRRFEPHTSSRKNEIPLNLKLNSFLQDTKNCQLNREI